LRWDLKVARAPSTL